MHMILTLSDFGIDKTDSEIETNLYRNRTKYLENETILGLKMGVFPLFIFVS